MNTSDYVDPLFRFALSHIIPRVSQRRSLLIVVFLSLSLFPQWARGGFPCPDAKGDIPFILKENDSFLLPMCLKCNGPWGRTSGFQDFDPIPCTFYAAERTLFPPFGKWTCSLFPTGPDGGCLTPSMDEVDFCVQPAPPDADNSVQLFIDKNEKLSVDQPAPPCSSSVSSFLGDNPKQEKSKPDTDEFRFDGAGGDQVTLRLEANPQEGNNGGEASLGISGNSLNESTSGTPPLELEVTLPGDGKYSVAVEQPKNSALRFRGSYNLDVESATGVGLIEPTNNVEK
ncbi:MAG: hypothetical protein WBD99_12890 [Thermodesulfobacteriota bacterium]